jgi:cysteinyl-tRNA synthetase
MSDYFGYDVHFVMNITDIDDKARALGRIVAQSLTFVLISVQIIQRARQQHLVQEFRKKTTFLTQRLVDDVHSAWAVYVRYLNKGLSPNEQIEEGKENEAWPLLVERVRDASWKQECLKRHEKFDMQFTEAVRVAPSFPRHPTHQT